MASPAELAPFPQPLQQPSPTPSQQLPQPSPMASRPQRSTRGKRKSSHFGEFTFEWPKSSANAAAAAAAAAAEQGGGVGALAVGAGSASTPRNWVPGEVAGAMPSLQVLLPLDFFLEAH